MATADIDTGSRAGYACYMLSQSHCLPAQSPETHRRPALRLLALIVLFLLLVAYAESSMAKYILFSPVSGKIVIAGKPVAGATVRRWYKGGFSDKQGTDTVTTDAAGNFSFPEVSFSSIMASIIPHEAVVSQKMMATVNGVETIIYATVKRNYDSNGEFGGLALNFVFDPTAQPTFVGKDPGIRVTLATN